jgi:hypothetical protein
MLEFFHLCWRIRRQKLCEPDKRLLVSNSAESLAKDVYQRAAVAALGTSKLCVGFAPGPPTNGAVNGTQQ